MKVNKTYGGVTKLLNFPFYRLFSNSLRPLLQSATMEDPYADENQYSVDERYQETTPLLKKTKSTDITYTAEIWILCKTSIPVIFAYMLQNSLQTACVLIVGRMVCY
jgi:hypothetical protein